MGGKLPQTAQPEFSATFSSSQQRSIITRRSVKLAMPRARCSVPVSYCVPHVLRSATGTLFSSSLTRWRNLLSFTVQLVYVDDFE
jgi:hypothetical protein